MTTTDRDGLSAVQIARINRIELARFRKPQEVFYIRGSFFRAENVPLIGLLVGILLIACAALVLVQNHWSPGTQLYTRLPNLNQQTPSITVYGEQK
jgi:hypothetical protein